MVIKKQNGNVLFIILIAVALFAALSYAVTSSTRSGSGDASRETVELQASQIVQYSTSIENAIMRMRLSNGCDDTQISFENAIVSGYTNSNAPADYRCHVFRPEGGNMAWSNPPREVVYNPGLGMHEFRTGSVWHLSGMGTDSNGDLYYTIGGTINHVSPAVVEKGANLLKVCERINSRLGIPSVPGGMTSLPKIASNGFSFNIFTGSYVVDNGGAMTIVGVSPGTRAFCAELGGYFNYYHVLIAR